MNGKTKKILIIFTHGNAFYPRAGNETRVNKLISQLLKNGNHIITLESSEYKDIGIEMGNVQRFFFNPIIINKNHIGSFFADFNPDLTLKLYRIIKRSQPDIIQVEYPRGVIVSKLLTKIHPFYRPLIIYDAHDVEQSRHFKVTMKEKNLSYLKRVVIFLYDSIIEKLSCICSDHILTVSDQDKLEFINLFKINANKISIIPTGTEIKHLDKSKKPILKKKLNLEIQKRIVLFHGVYSYYPNAEAIKLIENYIAPAISKKDLEIQFVIAGRGAPKCKNGNITYLGFIDSLEELFIVSDIAIVPVLHGGGTRVKILDYLGAGLPIVTTKKGIEGIDAENGKNAIIIDNVDERFIEAIYNLITDGILMEKIGNNAKDLAKKQYEWTSIGNKLNLLYSNIIPLDSNSQGESK